MGKLISIDALSLVWYRMFLATIFIAIFLVIKKNGFWVRKKSFQQLIFAGIALGLHWVTFFGAIKVSNVSVALMAMSTGAFFAALLEPLWYGRKVIWYEVVFGLITVLGLYIIFNVDSTLINGILLGLLSSFLGVVFTMINGQLIKVERSSVIGFYEMGIGALMLTIYLLVNADFSSRFFDLSQNDWIFLLILASVCTAYAFIASVKVMKFISPYTVLLTVNLEPVYGILLAIVIFGESEKMSPNFYLGALIIIVTVILNGILKNRQRLAQ